MKKLLIIGSSGMLGASLVNEFKNKYNLFGISKDYENDNIKKQYILDLTNSLELKTIIKSIDPDIVIHTAALTNVDLCEDAPALAFETNAIITKNLVSYIRPDTRFIYISTESVFDGSKGDYIETDVKNPLNSYAKTKFEGEKFVSNYSKNFIILRATIIGWNLIAKRISFIEWIANNLKTKTKIRMFSDVIISPISVNTLSIYLSELLTVTFVGTLHMGSCDSTSKYGFGLDFAEVFGYDKTLIQPISINDINLKAKRPKNVSLNTSKIASLIKPMPSIKEELISLYSQAQILKK